MVWIFVHSFAVKHFEVNQLTELLALDMTGSPHFHLSPLVGTYVEERILSHDHRERDFRELTL